jgi:hypothetical protein
MRFNETTHIISICVLILTAVYTLVYSGISGVLVCAAIAFIAAAFIDPIELVVAITILFVLLYTTVLKGYVRRFEGFTDANTITSFVRDKQNASASVKPSSVAQSFMEGFENPSTDSTSATKIEDAVSPTEVHEITNAIDEKKQKDKEISSEEFQSATNELFKLGKIPSEHKEGPMLDAGGTLMKAMGSFDPETTQKMTHDTKQLLETQKSLMNMLTQMRPILADGKELLQTFSGMFGGQSAGPFKVGK